MRLIIENIRTFADRHEIPIRPLTILTGENSSGKTTLLACLSAVTARHGFPLDPGFNEQPYSLGSYDNIATMGNGASGRAKTFSLGWAGDKGMDSTLATYRSAGGKLKLLEFVRLLPEGKITLTLNEGRERYPAPVSLTDT